MAGIRFGTRVNLSPLQQTVADIKREVRAELNALGNLLVKGVQGRMKEKRGTRERRSVKKRVDPRATGFALQVFSTDVLAAVDEEGRRRGAPPPPVRELLTWVVSRGLVEKITRAPKSPTSGSQINRARGAAYVVARSISRKGIPARHPFEKTFAANSARINAAMQEAVRRGAEGR